jgi:beta-galactosidase/beta-glucuronidase
MKNMKNTKDFHWEPIEDQIMTRWSRDVLPEEPLPEYPRPQFKRNEWLNLNGLWEYAIRPKEENHVDSYDGKILVPFPIESALSGVKKKLRPKQKLWYRRTFTIPDKWHSKKVLLHFGAVDWEATVWVNKNKLGTHQGGYTPFSFEISEFIDFNQENELVVEIWDPTDRGGQERGKQVLRPMAIWYTAVSGIWQTVWLEPVPKTYVKNFKLIPNIDKELLLVSLDVHKPSLECVARMEVRDGSTTILSVRRKIDDVIILNIPSPKLWSPDSPILYDLTIKIEQDNEVIDEVETYFGMRKISLSNEENGMKTIKLNNEKIFQYGTLDQGYWPDGLYTAPTDEALRYDIQITKELGFNLIRKHVKVEPARWYYHCDKIGILVWQDMPNGGVNYMTGLPPNINEYKDLREEHTKKNYYKELKSMILSLFNSPCIITWVPFNEGWGQFDTEKVTRLIKKMDPSRLVNAASGWFDFGVGDIFDQHSYPNPIMPNVNKIGSRAAVVGEFGGLGLEVENHMWNIKNKFVYRNLPDNQKLLKKYENLISKLKKLIEKGLSSAIYTQTTDVEGEVNGLLTYDREILKMDKEGLRELNRSLY